MSQPVYENLLLVMNDHWCRYHKLLKECRKKPRRSAVHDLRTLLRRIIAELDLLQAITNQKKICRLRRQFKRQLDSLRELRDVQVQEKTLKEGKPNLVGFPNFLKAKRKSEEKSVQRNLRRIRVRNLKAELLTVNEGLHTLAQDPRRAQNATRIFERVLRQKYDQLKSCVDQAKVEDLTTFHAARIQFRKYRYTWEVLKSNLPVSDAVQSSVNTFQNILGDLQDTVEMIRRLLNFLVEYGEPNPEAAFLNFLRAQEQKQVQQLERFLKEKNELLQQFQLAV